MCHSKKDKRSKALWGLKKCVPFQLHVTRRSEVEWKVEVRLSLPPALPNRTLRGTCLGTTASVCPQDLNQPCMHEERIKMVTVFYFFFLHDPF